MTDSFIYLHRKITEWEWYLNTNTFRIFIHCLLKANYKDKQWQGMTIKRGQFVTSQYRLADETGLSRTAVKHALKNLQKTKELTCESTTQNTIITVVNYDEYQTKDPQKICKKSELINKEGLHSSTTIHTHYNENVCVSEKEKRKSVQVSDSETGFARIASLTEPNGSKASPYPSEKIYKIQLTDSEKRVLQEYAKKSNARNIDAYVNSLIKNGGYVEILADYEKKQEQKKKIAAEKIKKENAEKQSAEKDKAEFLNRFSTKEQAFKYLKKNCGNFINPLQKELMKKFGIKEFEVKNVL